jgi:hypothetical protein
MMRDPASAQRVFRHAVSGKMVNPVRVGHTYLPGGPSQEPILGRRSPAPSASAPRLGHTPPGPSPAPRTCRRLVRRHTGQVGQRCRRRNFRNSCSHWGYGLRRAEVSPRWGFSARRATVPGTPDATYALTPATPADRDGPFFWTVGCLDIPKPCLVTAGSCPARGSQPSHPVPP